MASKLSKNFRHKNFIKLLFRTFNKIADIPTQLMRSGKCATVEINGSAGIMTRWGYFFDMQAKNWTKKANPPVNAISGMTNAMWTFRGRPTIFGHPVCDNDGMCENKEVWQYNPDKDMWEHLGDMLHSRTYTTVIEVPGEWCDVLTVPTNPPTSEPMTTTTSGAGANLTGMLAIVFSAVIARFL